VVSFFGQQRDVAGAHDHLVQAMEYVYLGGRQTLAAHDALVWCDDQHRAVNVEIQMQQMPQAAEHLRAGTVDGHAAGKSVGVAICIQDGDAKGRHQVETAAADGRLHGGDVAVAVVEHAKRCTVDQDGCHSCDYILMWYAAAAAAATLAKLCNFVVERRQQKNCTPATSPQMRHRDDLP
jgi:hypothetical protein